jgi:hypothetical protein
MPVANSETSPLLAEHGHEHVPTTHEPMDGYLVDEQDVIGMNPHSHSCKPPLRPSQPLKANHMMKFLTKSEALVCALH